jgi:hypothetical protein
VDPVCTRFAVVEAMSALSVAEQQFRDIAPLPWMRRSCRCATRHRKGHRGRFFRYLTKPIKIVEFMEALDIALHFAAQHGLGEEQEAVV